MSEKSTKKGSKTSTGGLRPEYRRDDLGQGVRGKYFKRHAEATNLVLLQPDVAKAFPTQASVNDALRGLIKVAQRVPHP